VPDNKSRLHDKRHTVH